LFLFEQRAMNPSKNEIKKPPAKPANILWRLLGPGLVTGAADDDPSGIATYSQAGAQFGYGLLWTVFLTMPFMIAIQLVSAQIGRVTGKGIVANVKDFAPRWVVISLVALLVMANTFNIAADLAAMGEALSLVIGGLDREHALIFAANFGVAAGVRAVPALCARPEVSHLGAVPIRGHCLHRTHSVGRSVRARCLAGCRG
jgi:Mn2+/Fe2+ NRAMP family transporter